MKNLAANFIKPLGLLLVHIVIQFLSIQNEVVAQNLDSLSRSLKNERDASKIERKDMRKKFKLLRYEHRRGGRNIRDIVFDFDKKVFVNDAENQDSIPTPPYEIHEMEGIRIKIINVNPFIYNVDLFELQGDHISNEKLLEGAQTNSLKLEVPQFKAMTINPIVVISSDNNKDSINNAKLKVRKEIIFDLYKKLKYLKTTKKQITDRIFLNEFIVKNKYNPNDGDSVISVQELGSLRYNIAIDTREIPGIDEEVAAIKKQITEQRIDTISIEVDFKIADKELAWRPKSQKILSSIANDSIQVLKNNLNQINRFIFLHNELLNTVKLSSNQFGIIEDFVNTLLQGVNVDNSGKLPFQYLKIHNDINRNCDAINLILNQLIIVDSAHELNYKLAQNDLKNFSDNFKAFDHSKLISQIMSILGLVQPKNFELNYQTLSIAENADFIKYRIEFKPNSSLSIPQAIGPYSLDMSFLVNEGLKLDISTGIILDFNLADPQSYFQKFSSTIGGQTFDSVRVQKSPGTGNITPSITMMLNAYKRSSLNFKPGFSVGFGVSSDIRFRLYGGPSLIVGRKERIMISSGAAFGPILRNSPGYQEGATFADNASLPTEVPTIQDKFKFGWYVGVGFNLSGNETKGFLEKIKFK